MRYFGEEWTKGNCGGCDFCLASGEASGEEVGEEVEVAVDDAVLSLPAGERPADWAPARMSEEPVRILL